MNTPFTEHLAGEPYRKSKSGEEYHHPLSPTALVICLSQFSFSEHFSGQ